MRRTALVACAFGWLLTTRSARADGQAWTGLEARVAVSDGRYGMPTHARWITEGRFGGPRDGLSFLLARGGPMWDLHRNVMLNVNGVQAVSSDARGVFTPETRLELEPNIRGRVGVFSTNIRQRSEVRWVSGEATYRHRAQLRVNLQPEGWRVVPYVSSEIFIVTRLRVAEVRNVVGLSVLPTKHLRLDAGYMIRPRRVEGDWDVSHVGVLSLTFAPAIAPVIESGGG